MNKDTIKGTMDDVAGRTKRQVGEWTGDTETQVNGAAQQVKGKFEKAVGNVKDAARDAGKNAQKNAQTNQELENEARERQRHEEERMHHQTIGS